jgi:hypothetical protein
MKSIEIVRNKLRKIFEKYQRRAFNIVEVLINEAGYSKQEIKKEGLAKSFSSSFFSFLCEEIYKIGLEKKQLINNLYLIKHLPKKEYVYICKREKAEDKGYKEVLPGITLHKEIFYKVLDKLGLEKTKKSYINYLIINNEELSENENYLLNYFSKNQIKKFKSFSRVEEVLEKEYNKKLKNKGRLIKIE